MSDNSKFLQGFESIVPPVVSLEGNVLNSIMQARENRLNREWAERQNDLSWQRQRQLIDEQRAYDTPKAQMQRLMEAGLNPNLIYDDLGGNMQAMNAPNAAGTYQGTAPQVDPLALSQAMLNLSQARKNNSDSDNNTKLTAAKIEEIYGNTKPSQANIDYLLASAEASRANASYILKGIDKLSSEIAKLDEEKKEIVLRNLFNERTFETNVKRLEAQFEIDRVTSENIQRTIDATIAEMLASASNSRAQAALAYSQKKLNEKELLVKDALISYYNACAKNQDANTAYVNVQKSLEKAYGGAIRAGQILNATQLVIYDDGVQTVVNKVTDRRNIEKFYQPKSWD